jgi:hypothetical protein
MWRISNQRFEIAVGASGAHTVPKRRYQAECRPGQCAGDRPIEGVSMRETRRRWMYVDGFALLSMWF